MIATEKKPRASGRHPLGHRTILCVDDEPLASRALYRLLSREPYDVLIADTPRQALRYVRDFDVDLVITDQRMPEMSGVELLSEVRQVSPSTSGLILTAYPESVMADDPPEPPTTPVFAKPWDDETLRVGIQEVLQSGARQAAGKAPAGGTPAIGLPTMIAAVDGAVDPKSLAGWRESLFGSSPVRIVVLQVLPRLGLHRDIYARLEQMVAALASKEIDASADVRWGDPAEQILLHARHADADLVILWDRELGGPRRLFRRSTAERILDEAEVPLFVLRADTAVRPWKRILVPLDGSREAESILPDALRLARNTGARIDLVGVSPRFLPLGYGYVPNFARIPDRMPYLAAMAGQVEGMDVPAEPRFFEGDPAGEILRHAQESGCDLICMAARTRARWARYFGGGVARGVLRGARCPVFVRKISRFPNSP
jgi:nucleotide-binding universal stress UspA family protein